MRFQHHVKDDAERCEGLPSVNASAAGKTTKVKKKKPQNQNKQTTIKKKNSLYLFVVPLTER